jgi:hypothetical protein
VDSEIVIGVDEKGDVNTTTALLHYFIPLGGQEPVNGALHFVFGKIASIDSSENVGDGFLPTEYDFIIDADVVQPMPEDVAFSPTPPLIVVSGTACAKKSDREFLMDIRQWVAGQQRLAGHVCLFPETNRRFCDKAPLPRQGAMISIVGCVRDLAIQTHGDHPLKRIPINVKEIAFLSSDSSVSSLPSPTKGKSSKFVWTKGGNSQESTTASSPKRKQDLKEAQGAPSASQESSTSLHLDTATSGEYEEDTLSDTSNIPKGKGKRKRA